MRLAEIELEWFRGAADPIALPVKGKSIVVYGPNGAGKSSFVDALEYFLAKGKIGHLTHEYSGKKQEKGVINTHKPTLKPTRATIEFVDGSKANINVKSNGTSSMEGDGCKHLDGLDYRRVVLRQDEVARFVSSAKGEKYSALLPLLGLEELECAAENVRQLAKRIAKESDLDAKRYDLSRQMQATNDVFKSAADLEGQISALHSKYRGDMLRESDLTGDCREIEATIGSRVAGLTPDVQKHAALQNLARIAVEDRLKDVDGIEVEVAKLSVKNLEERLAVLENAAKLIAGGNEEHVQCPACGTEIGRVDLAAHLKLERQRFAGEKILLGRYAASIDALVNSLSTAKAAGTHDTAAGWWIAQKPDGGHDDVAWLTNLQPNAARGSAAPELREAVRTRLVPMIHAARVATKQAPPGTQELLSDSETARAAAAVLATRSLTAEVSRLNDLVAYVQGVEDKVRLEIRERSDAVVADISTDIQRMWGILHPGHEIENVCLRHPDESDKAIDIELKFFGVELKSPRLTLSEGNRNSLGLCVFLSMARRASDQTPVVLDDVVVSLDRDHRGMVVELLQKEFDDRQVIMFTHDRDWFAELKHMLGSPWEFYALMPYAGPTKGIAWSSRLSGLDDARVHVATAPDAAANIARKVMDTELGFLADKLRLRMEFRQGQRNDHRMAHEFLTGLLGACKLAYQTKAPNGEYQAKTDIASLLELTDKQLLTWGNKGSHTFELAPAEAAKLVDNCEAVLAAFNCDGCNKPVYRFDDDKGTCQCSCGLIRWRYSKL